MKAATVSWTTEAIESTHHAKVLSLSFFTPLMHVHQKLMRSLTAHKHTRPSSVGWNASRSASAYTMLIERYRLNNMGHS